MVTSIMRRGLASMAYEIRQLQAADAAEYRDLRLEALEKCPEAFSSSHAEDEGLPVARYEAAIATNIILGGFRYAHLQGVIALARSNSVKMHHRMTISGIYVREAERGKGLSDELVQAARKFALDGIESIYYRVPSNNKNAVALCQRSGFEQIGIEPHAIRLDDGHYIDHLLMHCAVSH
jgi:RimJ/RimL family protein N-acetyltransferase